MKDKIIFLIIGILIGAIIATSGFLIYSKSSSSNKGNLPEIMQMNPKNQDGNNISSENMGTPPEKPDGDNGLEPSAKSGESISNQNTNT